MKLDKQIEMNIKTLIDIRDDVGTSPAVRIQAIQTLQKIMDSLNVVESDTQPNEEEILNKIRGSKK